MRWPLKKNPSQVAHVDTPWPMRRRSLSRPSILARAPVATMTARAWYSASPTQTRYGAWEKSTRSILSVTYSAPKRAAWARMLPISSGPWMPSMKPG